MTQSSWNLRHNTPQSTQLRSVDVTQEFEQSKHPIHEELKEIFRQAKRAESPQERKRLRREGLRRMMAAPAQCFWAGYPPQYRDDLRYLEAANYAWDYIERKIHGKIRGRGTAEEKAYDPDKGASPITLWNQSCKGRYEDIRTQQNEWINPNPIDPRTGELLNIDDLPQPELEDNLSASERIYQVRQIVEADAEGKYKNHHVRKTPPPPITIQAAMLAICDITLRGEKWTLKKLAQQFGIPEGTINGKPKKTIGKFFREIGEIIRSN